MRDRIFEAMKIGVNDCLPWFIAMVGIIWMADLAEDMGWHVAKIALGLCGAGVAFYTMHVMTLRAWRKSALTPRP